MSQLCCENLQTGAILFDTHKCDIFTHRNLAEGDMRTNIEIDDKLMREAMQRSGARTKRAAVEAGLRLLAQTYAQGSIRQLKGKVRWEGDLAQLRRSRVEAQEG